MVAPTCTTVVTPRIAWRIEVGLARSPSVMLTRTRSGPSRRGSRTRQRTSCPAPRRRRSKADPIRPVAPVSRIMVGRSLVRNGSYLPYPWNPQQYSARCQQAGRNGPTRIPLDRKAPRETNDLCDRGTLHRPEGQLLRGGLPGRLHPPDAGRAGLREGRDAL